MSISQTTSILISGSGLHTPADCITNDDLVSSFNAYVRRFNEKNAQDIEAGRVEPMHESSSEFIEKASGIRQRYVIDRKGILDIDVMHPLVETRSNDEPSQMCEMSVDAANQALAAAGLCGDDIDGVILGSSNLQRAYPAVAVEVQHYLGIDGWAYDINVACASAAFGLLAGVNAIRSGNARRVLVINPEIMTGHLNFRDRDSHFIFGDACTALVLEEESVCKSSDNFLVLGTRLRTRYSNNIRNNGGFLNRSEISPRTEADRLFVQNGRKVFKEVVPMVSGVIGEHLRELKLDRDQISRLWLHQANHSMDRLIAKKVLRRDVTEEEMPTILHEYGNTSSAGSVIAFHKHHDDLVAGDIGIICGFGAGYSVGSVVVQKL